MRIFVLTVFLFASGCGGREQASEAPATPVTPPRREVPAAASSAKPPAAEDPVTIRDAECEWRGLPKGCKAPGSSRKAGSGESQDQINEEDFMRAARDRSKGISPL